MSYYTINWSNIINAYNNVIDPRYFNKSEAFNLSNSI